MRKALLLAAAFAAAISLAFVAPSALGALNDAKGPKCADIVNGSFGLNSGTLAGTVRTAAPACNAVTYTLYADGVAVATGTPSQVIDTLVSFNATLPAGTTSTCVYATSTAGQGPHVFDRAPDTGCVTVEEGGSGGLQGFD